MEWGGLKTEKIFVFLVYMVSWFVLTQRAKKRLSIDFLQMLHYTKKSVQKLIDNITDG